MNTKSMILGAALIALATPALAGVSCNVEASGGVSATTTEASTGGVSVDFGSEGGLVGLGAGCDYRFGNQPWIVGVLGRFDWLNSDASIAGGTSIDTDDQWMAAVRAGYFVNPSLLAYGLIGGAGSSQGITGLSTTHPEGLVVGGGVEFAVDGLPVDIRFEVDHYRFGNETIGGVQVDHSSTSVRLGVVYRVFGSLN